jgi:hypothetical protein
MSNIMQSVFSNIYRTNNWGSGESRSGAGSTEHYTRGLRTNLPELINKLDIKTVLDAPCGDFNWMKYILPNLNVDYIGADVVPQLIWNNNKLYKSDTVNFMILDVTVDDLPNVDLMICRDCLFHFPNDEIHTFFENFIKSDIKYIFTTTHYNGGPPCLAPFENKDIQVGEYRHLDLFSEPFNLPEDVLYRTPDWVPPYNPREMVVFSREQIIERYG